MTRLFRRRIVFGALALGSLLATVLPLVGPTDGIAQSEQLDAPELLRVWGSVGDGAGEFQSPWGIAIDDNRIYVTDHKNSRVQVFSPDGTFQRLWGGSGAAEGRMRGPVGIDVGPTGDVYVADSQNHRVQVFSPDGTFQRAWRDPNADPFGDGPELTPWGLDVGPDRNVFVSDLQRHRVFKFGPKGELLTQWGGRGTEPGRFTGPTGIAVSPQGRVYVVDSLNHRVQVFDRAGNVQFTWGDQCSLYLHPGQGCEDPDGDGPLGETDAQFDSPWGITRDTQGRVYVADSANKRVQVFSAEGEFRLKWGERGREPGQFDNDVNVAVDSRGRIFVVDLNNQRIQAFSPLAR